MRMVIDKICKMTVKGVKSTSESFFSISHGVWSYGGKTLRRRNSPPPAWIGLMNNAVLGKTMENIRKHINIRLVTNKESYLRTVMRPNFVSGVLFGENLMGCKMGRIKVVMNKPVYLGQAILDLSKIVMYEYHYDCMVPKYGETLTPCYMETDLLVYHIKAKDFYDDIADDVEERFYTSGYSGRPCNNRPLPVGINKKVIGLMKDKLRGAIMTEFVALRP